MFTTGYKHVEIGLGWQGCLQGSIIMIDLVHSKKIKRKDLGKIETKKVVLVQERWANIRGKR